MPGYGQPAQHITGLLPLQPIAVKRGKWVRRVHAGGHKRGRRPEACKSGYVKAISPSEDTWRTYARAGSILFAFIGIIVAVLLFLRSERKKAAVGRREMQFFLVGYIIISICEIFTIGGFPLDGIVRRAFVAAHLASIVATTWILMMNGAVGYQLLDDGTLLSVGLIFGSAAALFIGTGYIALDTGFTWTNYWRSSLQAPNTAYALFTLYQIVPLFFLVVFFILEAVLVLRVLGEKRPMSE